MTNKFPTNYPKCLEAVSWNFNDKFGILPRWNKYTNTIKNNPYFVENKIKNYILTYYLKDAQTIPKTILKIINYIADCFSVKWTDDEFIISVKKEEVDGKYVEKFKKEDFHKLTDQALITHNEANEFLKKCLNFIKNDYNKIIAKS